MVFLDLLLSKMLRPFLSGLVSKKRISQGFFRQLVEETNVYFGERVALYVNSQDFEELVESDGIPLGTKIVVVGGDDLDFNCEKISGLQLRQGIKFFIQHLDCPESGNVYLLPIGIEDLSRARNGLNWHFTKRKRTSRKVNKMLVGPFKITDPSRSQLAKTALEMPRITLLENRKASFIYSYLASRHRFILCPRGAGIDTHRFWESLYRGSIPIVLKSNWSETLSHYDIPFIQVDAWEKIQFLDFDAFDKPQPDNLDYLLTDWWVSRFASLVRQG
jgi:hypothetical protein